MGKWGKSKMAKSDSKLVTYKEVYLCLTACDKDFVSLQRVRGKRRNDFGLNLLEGFVFVEERLPMNLEGGLRRQELQAVIEKYRGAYFSVKK